MIVLLLLLTLAALVYPLFKGRDTLATREAFDANVYKDQLRAIDRELDEGQIDREDAEAARIEISRKLLAAAEKAEHSPAMKQQGRQMSRAMAMALVVAVPLFAVALYLQVGSPALPDLPLEARARVAPVPENKIAELIRRAEQRLASKPDDAQGWEIMAPIYLRHQMYGKAENAFRQSIRLSGPNAERLSGLADAIVLGNNGIVTDDVLPILKKAIKADPDHPKPHFWMGLYFEQHGKYDLAEQTYTTLLKTSGEDVVWRPTVAERLNVVRKKQGLSPIRVAGIKRVQEPDIKLGDALKADTGKKVASAGRMPGPTAEQMRAARNMSAGDRQAMINSMVARLSNRLYKQGGDLKSWMRLVNVLNVQGKKDEARKAVEAGKKNLGTREAAAQLDGLAARLGLGGSVPPARSRVAGGMPGPTAAQMRAARNMSARDRQAMINSMVARLSNRLYKQGGDLKSWMRLVNVLNVQGKKDEARKAVEAGKKNLGTREAAAQLDGLAARLGLGS